MRNAIHVVGHALAVEVDPRGLAHPVGEDGLDSVALDHIDPWPGPRPVEAEPIERRLLRVDLVLDLIDGQIEDLDPVLDPGFSVGLVPESVHLPRLAAQESLHDLECVRVMSGVLGRSTRHGMTAVRGRGRRRGAGRA